MRVYRLRVSSADRLPGETEASFSADAAHIVTARDFVERSWMVGVEWMTPISYSSDADCLVLGCPTIPQRDSFESWTGNTSSALAHLQLLTGTNVFGATNDPPYLRTRSLGVPVRGDALNARGTFRFVVREFRSQDGLVTEVGNPSQLSDFSFSLVFWEVCDPAGSTRGPGNELVSPPQFRLLLQSNDAPTSTPADCRVPVRVSLGAARLGGRWRACVRPLAPIIYVGSSDLNAIAVACDELRDSSNPSGVLAVLPRFPSGGSPRFGQLLTTKPIASDSVAHPVTTALDKLTDVRVRLLNAVTLEPLVSADVLDWLLLIHFFAC